MSAGEDVQIIDVDIGPQRLRDWRVSLAKKFGVGVGGDEKATAAISHNFFTGHAG